MRGQAWLPIFRSKSKRCLLDVFPNTPFTVANTYDQMDNYLHTTYQVMLQRGKNVKKKKFSTQCYLSVIRSLTKMLPSTKAGKQQYVNKWNQCYHDVSELDCFLSGCFDCFQSASMLQANHSANNSNKITAIFSRLCLKLAVTLRLRVWDPGKFTSLSFFS